ncbi:MAG: hypothetical protein ACXVDD_15310 [Polyangia bacterium]
MRGHPVREVHLDPSMQLVVEDIDLAQLTGALRRRYGRHLFASYLRGKTLIRDAILEQLGCSAYEAEELVETLELMGYVRFPHLADDTHPLTRHSWIIGEPSP